MILDQTRKPRVYLIIKADFLAHVAQPIIDAVIGPEITDMFGKHLFLLSLPTRQPFWR
jgi:hypothetical protein